jgi:hypothetical protein
MEQPDINRNLFLQSFVQHDVAMRKPAQHHSSYLLDPFEPVVTVDR